MFFRRMWLFSPKAEAQTRPHTVQLDPCRLGGGGLRCSCLRSAGFRGAGPGPPTMLMCLVIYATCACHLVIFSEKRLFVERYYLIRSAKQQQAISLEEYLIL